MALRSVLPGVPVIAILRGRSDLLPDLPSFIRRVCSGYAPVWGVLRTRLV